MKNKIIVAVAGIALIMTFMAGCSQGNPAPASSTTTTPVAQSSVTPSALDATSGVLQNTICLKITEPADAAEINSKTVTVKGQTIPGATVTVNDTVTTADDNGNFSITISLVQGPNAIDVIATDDSGRQGEVLILVNAVY